MNERTQPRNWRVVAADHHGEFSDLTEQQALTIAATLNDRCRWAGAWFATAAAPGPPEVPEGAHRWTAQVERYPEPDADFARLTIRGSGDHQRHVVSVIAADEAESLAAQINRTSEQLAAEPYGAVATAHLVTLRAIAAEPHNPQIQRQWSMRLQSMAMEGLVWRFLDGYWKITEYGRRVLTLAEGGK